MPGVSDPKFLFLGEQAWRAAPPAGPLRAGPEGRLQLLPMAAPVPGASPDIHSVAAGIASGTGGRLFWTDPVAGAIWVQQGERATPLPGVGLSGQFRNVAALATGPRGALYVADRGNDRIQVFALDHYQRIDVWDGFAAPHGLAASPDGRLLYVTETGRAGAGVTVVDTRSGQRLGAIGAGLLKTPRGLCVAPDGRLYVADPSLFHDGTAKGKGGVAVFSPEGEVLLQFAASEPTAVTAGPHRIWVGSESGGGIEQFLPDGSPAGTSSYYTGPAHDLHYVPAADRLYVATGAAGWNDPNTAAGPLVMAAAGAYAPAGSLITEPLDSKLPDCQWHKLVLRAAIPYGTRLTVETRTAPVLLSIGELEDGDWSEPVLFTGEAEGEMDLAVLAQPGRYLWLRITLEGSGVTTPELTWVRAYYPRSTYTDYLPPVFRSDPVSADFLDRFMLLFEHFLGDWEQKIDHMADLFSPQASPHLPELASWLDFRLNGRLPAAQQREWLSRAMDLHHERGTVQGLQELLRMYTDPNRPPVIVEGFTRRGFARLGDADAVEPGMGMQLGADTVLPGAPEGELVLGADRLGNGDLLVAGPALLASGAHQFTVFSYQYPGQPADQLAVLDAVLQAERPAQTLHALCEIRPAMRVGPQSIIGVDTVLAGTYPPAEAGGPELAAMALPGPGQTPQPGALRTELRPHAPVLDHGNRLR
ncbi:MAG TPA: hypothetical protein VK464_16135 [Symbiobacteriaceae bacterium]|nr:hypothetical protein [Symbiobacteriaceae bacterium]